MSRLGRRQSTGTASGAIHIVTRRDAMKFKRGDVVGKLEDLDHLPFGCFFLDAEYKVYRVIGNGKYARYTHTVDAGDIELPIKLLDVEPDDTRKV